MTKILSSTFFDRPVLDVCPDLLGNFLVTKDGAWMITEVEAYDGMDDLACHARHGKTERNAPMFGKPGYRYLYMIYGMYWMLNIVTGPGNHPSAILIRGIEGYDGPGKLTKNLKIDKSFNNKIANKKTGLWIEDRGIIITKKQIATAPRTGIDYAGERALKPRKFYLEL